VAEGVQNERANVRTHACPRCGSADTRTSESQGPLSGLIPNSQAWLDYWLPKVDRIIFGEDDTPERIATNRLTIPLTTACASPKQDSTRPGRGRRSTPEGRYVTFDEPATRKSSKL